MKNKNNKIIVSRMVSAALGASLCAAIVVQLLGHSTEQPREGIEPSGEVKPGGTPQGLSTTEWASIRTQVEQSRYQLQSSDQPSDQRVSGANPGQGWTLEFDARGLSLSQTEPAVTSDVGRFKPKAEPTSGPSSIAQASSARLAPPAQVGSAREQHAGLTRPTSATPATDQGLRLRTTAIGRAGALSPVTGVTPVSRENKVELHHAQATEWFVNSAVGLEHGYTFAREPEGQRGEVRIQLAVEGAFKVQPAVGDQSDGVWLTDTSGTQRMRYHKLLVVDANERKLDARMEVQGADHIEIAFDDTAATYPVTVDPLLVNQEFQFFAGDGDAFDRFGGSVAVHADTAVIGADQDLINGKKNQGSAYVFVHNTDGTWFQQAKLMANDGAALDYFGRSVSVHGNTVVVGAPSKDISGGSLSNQGAAYVFVRDSAGAWSQQDRLVASDAGNGDSIGRSVSISGETVVVGGGNRNAAYVFTRSSNRTWRQVTKLINPDGEDGPNYFGGAVALSGDTIAVGDKGGGFEEGHAFVFVRGSTGAWTPQQRLSPNDSAPDDTFGDSVAVSGDSILIGASEAKLDGLTTGSAYVFVRSNGVWVQQAQLLPGVRIDNARFGESVSLSGDIAAVGEREDGANGVAYLYNRNGARWSAPTRVLASDGMFDDDFGGSVAVSGSSAVIGAKRHKVGFNTEQGSAYAYRFTVTPDLDFGDAPDPSYPTLLVSNGARHALNGPKLGVNIDAEADAQTNPGSGATGDDIAGIDDEDGVQFGSLSAGQSATVDVEVTGGPAKLDAWIDFNRDGDWADAGEQIFDDFNVVSGPNNGLAFTVPSAAVAGITFARVRLSSVGVASFTGEAPDGEVEDQQVTIENPPAGTVQLSAATYSVNENQTQTTLTLTRTGGSFGVATVIFQSADGSATDGSDYSGVSEVVIWEDGDSADKTLDIAISPDTTDEPDETINLMLSFATGAALGSPSTAVLTLVDDDESPPGTVQLSAATYSVSEAGPAASLTLTRVGGSFGTASVRLTTSNGSATAGSDYTAISQVVSWANNDSANKTVTVAINNDAADEPDETVNLALSSAGGATLGSPSAAVLTIIDNDEPPPLPTISIDDVAAAELNSGTRNVSFTVRLSAAASGPVSVGYVTANGSATAGNDYNATSGTVIFPAGQTVQTISVGVFGDTTVEPDEMFSVNLSSPAGATISDGSGTGTILNDDVVPPPTLTIEDASATELNSGTGNVSFTVHLSAAASGPVSVSYATANGSATAGSDYNAGSGTVIFPAGQTAQTVSVGVRGDTTVEPDETFTISLSSPVGATITRGTATGTIRNDDVRPGPTIRINDVSVTEGAKGKSKAMNFSVTLSQSSTQTVTVNYATANATAAAPTDYTAKSGSLSFAPGTTSKPVSVTVKGDSTKELDETFSVNLSAAANATIDDGQGIGTIRNDDGQPPPAGSVPSISSVSPSSYPAGTSNRTMTINGSNFVRGATLTFDPPTGSNLNSTASRLTFVSSSRIDYQFNNGSDRGTWTVRVNNPGGQQSSARSFTVN